MGWLLISMTEISTIREIDELQLYFGDDYYINDKIVIQQPTIGDIVSMGEKKYYSMISIFTSIPSDLKGQLADMGVDYEAITDFELFQMSYGDIPNYDSSILFGNLDFGGFLRAIDPLNDETVLYNPELDVVIDSVIHKIMADYIRKMHGIIPKVERAANAHTKKILIEESRQKIAMAKDKPYKSGLQTLVSSMVNSEGFKYKLQELKDVGIYEFMDSVQRIQIIKSASSLLNGCHSGNIDATKINKEELNWMRELKTERVPASKLKQL